MTNFSLHSSAFEGGKAMPSKHAHRGVLGGRNISVPLNWQNPPAGARSFALACIDLHPIANKWVHWLVVNIPGNCRDLGEGASLTSSMPKESVELTNSFGEPGYGGPFPPKGSGQHKYEFSLYALRVDMIQLTAGTSLTVFMKALENAVLGRAGLIGVYER